MLAFASAGVLALTPSPFAAVSLAQVAPPDKLRESFEQRVQRDPDDFIAWNTLGDHYLQVLSKTGDDSYLRLAARAAERSLEAVPAELNPAGLAIKAGAQLAAHRFAEARESATELRTLMPGKILPLQILGDALLELGDYGRAAECFHEMHQAGGNSVAVESRLARLDLIHGRTEQARERLVSALTAARTLSPRAPEIVAWCHVQLGELAFKHGDWDTAEAAYRSACEEQPDYFPALEHMAELHGARGRVDEAITLYQTLIARLARPDLLQAFGNLLLFVGQSDSAKRWHDQARNAYLDSVARGDVHYFHHLAGFFADSQPDPAKAVEWARKDLELRQGIHAYDALAWALYKDGQIAAAVEASEKALGTGTKDSHVLYHAGLIRMAAGNLAGGKRALQAALAINPRYNTFHVHR